MSVIGSSIGMLPGMDSVYSTYETEFRWGGPPNRALITGGVVDAATVDAAASPTYRVRRGLLLGKITSTGKWTQFSDTATDGSQVAQGILMVDLRMSDVLSGSTADRNAWIMVSGPVIASKVVGLTQKARADMFGRFVFDDDFVGNSSGWRNVTAKTADYTVVAADNNTIFTNAGAAGAVIFTLPTIAKGLRYRFFVEADQTLTVTAAVAGTLVVLNDAAANSVGYATASEKIGGSFEVYANAAATKWIVFPMAYTDVGTVTQTITVAT